MNIYVFRKYIDRDGLFRTWEYDYIEIKGLELPERPAGYTLFTITRIDDEARTTSAGPA